MQGAPLSDEHFSRQQLSQAVERGILRDVAYILAQVPATTVDEDGNTPLHEAARHGHRGICLRLVVGEHASFKVKNNEGQVPMDVAKENGHGDLLTILQKMPISVLSVPVRHDDADSSALSSLFRAPHTTLRLPPGSSAAEKLHLLPSLAPRTRASSTPVPQQNRALGPAEESYPTIMRMLTRLNIFEPDDQDVLYGFFDKLHRFEAQPGDVVFSEGDTAHEGFYIALSGGFKVLRKDPQSEGQVTVGSFTAPAMFGELGVIYQTRRHCTVTAARPAVLCRVPAVVFDAMIEGTSGRFVSRNREEPHPGGTTTTDRSSSSRVDGSSEGRRHKLFSWLSFRRRPKSTTHSSSSSSSTPRGGANPSPPRASLTTTSSAARAAKARGRSASANTSHGGVAMSDLAGSSWGSRLLRRGAHSRSNKRGGARESATPAATILNTTPDHVVKLTDDGRHLITAATKTMLITLVLSCSYGDDDFLVVDFLATFRKYMTPSDVLDRIESNFSRADPGQRDRILRIMAHWTEPPPNQSDLQLTADYDTQARMRGLLEEWRDTVGHLKTFQRILSHLDRLSKAPGRYAFSRFDTAQGSTQIRVKITKPGGHRDDMLFNITENTRLEDVKHEVCRITSERASKYFLNEASAGRSSGEGRLLFMDPGSYHFRAPFFGTEVDNKTNLIESHMTEILLVPLKTYSSGMFTSTHLETEAIAELLTMLDFLAYQQLDPREILNQRWRKHKEDAPAMTDITDRFNSVCDWMATAILSEKAAWQRAEVIEKMIELADRFYELHNFHGVVQVLSALRTVAVKRLRKTWALVSESKRAILDTMNAIITPDNNRQAYRSKLDSIAKEFDHVAFGGVSRKRCVSPCLPYIGFFLSDIIYIEDGNKDFLKSYQARGMAEPVEESDMLELVNFYKFRAISRVVEDVRVYQRAPYTTEHLPSATPIRVAFARWYLEHFKAMDEDACWEQSLKLEPPARSEQLQKRATKEGAFMNSLQWRAVREVGMNLTTVVESGQKRGRGQSATTQASSGSAAPVPTMRFLGSYEMPRGGRVEAIKQIKKLLAKPQQLHKYSLVTGDVTDGHIILTEPRNHDIVCSRPMSSLSFYNYESASKLLYLVTETELSEIHFLYADGHEPEDVFFNIHRGIQRWIKSSRDASNKAREAAVAKLQDEENPAPNGAFVLRDSTSRPGHYALSLKYDGEITHFLIETVPGGVCFKDSDLVFKSLQDLIIYHCVQPAELPCRLNPDCSDFLTKDCERIASNQLPEASSSVSALANNLWYFKGLSRVEANDRLASYGPVPGMFLVRDSSAGPNAYALSLVDENNEILHVLIQDNGSCFELDGKPCAPTLAEVIDVCSQPGQSWLPCTLTIPCPRVPRDSLPARPPGGDGDSDTSSARGSEAVSIGGSSTSQVQRQLTEGSTSTIRADDFTSGGSGDGGERTNEPNLRLVAARGGGGARDQRQDEDDDDDDEDDDGLYHDIGLAPPPPERDTDVHGYVRSSLFTTPSQNKLKPSLMSASRLPADSSARTPRPGSSDSSSRASPAFDVSPGALTPQPQRRAVEHGGADVTGTATAAATVTHTPMYDRPVSSHSQTRGPYYNLNVNELQSLQLQQQQQQPSQLAMRRSSHVSSTTLSPVRPTMPTWKEEEEGQGDEAATDQSVVQQQQQQQQQQHGLEERQQVGSSVHLLDLERGASARRSQQGRESSNSNSGGSGGSDSSSKDRETNKQKKKQVPKYATSVV